MFQSYFSTNMETSDLSIPLCNSMLLMVGGLRRRNKHETNWNGHLWLSIQWDVVCANAQNNYWEHKRRIKVVKLQMWIHFTTYQITMGSGTPLVQNCTTQLLRGFFLWNTKNTFLERFIYVWWTCIHQMML